MHFPFIKYLKKPGQILWNIIRVFWNIISDYHVPVPQNYKLDFTPPISDRGEVCLLSARGLRKHEGCNLPDEGCDFLRQSLNIYMQYHHTCYIVILNYCFKLGHKICRGSSLYLRIFIANIASQFTPKGR